jgi:RNA polymerase sigma-70 factor (ECF subfamily)
VLERYHREVLIFRTRKHSDREAAADLAQESCLRVLSAQSSGRAVMDMRALLYRTARNLLVDQLRRDGLRRHDSMDCLAEHQLPAAPRHLQPEEALASLQSVRGYLDTIEDLPPRCREAFTLYVFEELGHAQIAERMGISVSMVEKHVVRGMVACRLRARGLQEADGSAGLPAQDAGRLP